MNPGLSQRGNFAKQHNKQSGAALIIFFLALMLAGSAVLFSVLDSNSVKIERDKNTATALAKAKVALIARAVMDSSMPGSLPCPSTTVTYDGVANMLSGNACPTYIGWFPWKTLSIGDLRDGYSERLWYALSPAYRDDTSAQPLNSDTAGTLSVDGRGDIVAIIFAPGPSLSQSRPSNNATDYLEGTNSDGDTVYTATLSTTNNDRLITISRDEIMRAVEKRVAGEVLSCLRDYNQNANSGEGDGNLDRHPWPTNGAGAYPSFVESVNRRFGRIPDTPFTLTRGSSSNLMSASWATTPGPCKPITDGWWSSWKELVFYAVADAKDPNNFTSYACNNPILTPFPQQYCLSIITLSGTQTEKRVAVIVAGKVLAGQARSTTTDKQTLSNYLEGENISTAGGMTVNLGGEDIIFEQKPATTTFNDVVVFY